VSVDKSESVCVSCDPFQIASVIKFVMNHDVPFLIKSYKYLIIFGVQIILRIQIILFVKKRVHTSYKVSHDRNVFSNLRARYNIEYKRCYKLFLSQTESMFITNPRSFWDFVRNVIEKLEASLCYSLVKRNF